MFCHRDCMSFCLSRQITPHCFQSTIYTQICALSALIRCASSTMQQLYITQLFKLGFYCWRTVLPYGTNLVADHLVLPVEKYTRCKLQHSPWSILSYSHSEVLQEVRHPPDDTLEVCERQSSIHGVHFMENLLKHLKTHIHACSCNPEHGLFLCNWFRNLPHMSSPCQFLLA